MPIYEYETIPESGKKSRRFEIRQRMNDEPLTAHPETGEPIRRVFSAFSVGSSAPDFPASGGCACGDPHGPCGLN